MSRYDTREVNIIDLKLKPKDTRKDLLGKRGVKRLDYYASPKFAKVTERMIKDSEYVVRTWSNGDRFYKLASEFYGDPELWWIIAFFNKKPTDGHVLIGEKILIPTSMEQIYDAVAR